MARQPAQPPADPSPGESGYDSASWARRVVEPAKRAQFGDAGRSEFARDRARVLHCSAFRRLADKTQVVDPGADDFPRTRLTHSLEVAQIAREMGGSLGCSADVVDAAGLAHDLGHPPFGHNGEAALDEVCSGAGGFEGNAQTFRILTRLEPRSDGPAGPAGLNLTRAVLDAATKYPWPRQAAGTKFGVYDDDLPAFGWVRADRDDATVDDPTVDDPTVDEPTVDDPTVDERRCLEAQVMDWADDVAYSVHDLEDAVCTGQIVLERVTDVEADRVLGLAGGFGPWSALELGQGMDRLLALPALSDLRGFDRSYAALAAVKRSTSELTGRFVGAAVQATRAVAGPGRLTRYGAELVVPAAVAVECAVLKALATHFVMHSTPAEQRRLEQRRLLHELVDALGPAAPAALEPALRPAWEQAGDDAARLRVIIDQVAQLTDSSARSWHRRWVVQPD